MRPLPPVPAPPTAAKRPLTRRACTALAIVVALAGSAIVVSGCRAVTVAELDQYGTHTYPGRSKGQMMRVVGASLRSLGYEIALTDDAAGRVKTAPKLVVVHASGNAYGARATGSSVAWTIDVSSGRSGAIVHATPRGYEAGQAVESTRFEAGYAKKAFQTLFDEIDSNLPGGADRSATGGLGLRGAPRAQAALER